MDYTAEVFDPELDREGRAQKVFNLIEHKDSLHGDGSAPTAP